MIRFQSHRAYGHLAPIAVLVTSAVLFLMFLPACVAADTTSGINPLALWYLQPATSAMNEALPIGNGRIGALVFGGTAQEQLVLNDDSLWTGDDNPSGDYGTMGAYQELGVLLIDLPGHQLCTNYRRDLDLTTATAHVSYQIGAITFKREYFASNPAQVIVAKLTADHPGSYTGSIELNGAHAETTVAEPGLVSFQGKLPNGMLYAAAVRVIVDGGSAEVKGNSISFNGCNSVEIIEGAGTSYVMDYSRGYHGNNPLPRMSQQIESAAKSSYSSLRRDHIADYQHLFNRVSLSLGDSPESATALPTDARKILAAEANDPGLEQILFQYGRYLLISCSRSGSLPANLQGLWNDSNSPPWDSDYHTDINIEMNYWPSEVTNLSECHMPLFDLIESQIPAWRIATQNAPEYKTSSVQNADGFDLRASFNITGGMGWLWIKTSDAWLCEDYWQHFAFTRDQSFLRMRAYPVLKETTQFWIDHLKALSDGSLVVPQGWSPEHGPFADGVSFNQELVWDLFNNYVKASTILNIDPDLRAQVLQMREKLLQPKVGKWGQLTEWAEDIDDPNDHHRHTSNLVGVFPGNEFTVSGTPVMLKAAKTSLQHRGNEGDVTEWAYAWRTALAARMGDGKLADSFLTPFFANRNSCNNLFGYCPPMQIDGNFGMTAAMGEMVLQSSDNEIDLLPALSPNWRSGYVKGLRARGGFVVDEYWTGGKLSKAAIFSVAGTSCLLRYGDEEIKLMFKPGQKIELNSRLTQVH